MEKKKEVKVFLTRKFCDCGGEMVPDGMVLTSYPPHYSHTCNKCGKVEAYWDRYPKMEYEEV